MAPHSYGEILFRPLSPSTHLLFSLPISAQNPIFPSSAISNLSLHPVLESILHVLNYDLPTAHLLRRHMQAPPAYESMFLHGVLHRVEGDLENSRAWYVDVQDAEAFRVFWGPADGNGGSGGEGGDEVGGAQGHLRSCGSAAPVNSSRTAIDHVLLFLDSLVEARATVRSGLKPPRDLIETSLGEVLRLWAFCEKKFGTEPVWEASDIWVSMAEKHADVARENDYKW